MNFTTNIESYNADFNLNAIRDYNSYLNKQASFEIDVDGPDFSTTLDKVSKSTPIRDKNDPTGVGNFINQMGNSFGNALDSVNRMKLEADRLQEDLAQGGGTSIHEAMIAAEKAELSMNMAVQIRNRILNAYTEISSMTL